MKVNLVDAGFSAATGAIAIISLLVGKTPYLGFFRRNFVAWRKRDPGHYWSMIAQYFGACIIFAALALLVQS